MSENNQNNESTENKNSKPDQVTPADQQENAELTELEQLRAEKEQLLKKQKQIEQKDLSEQQKELLALKEELTELAKGPILDSKLFNAKELDSYDYKELRAMAKVLEKLDKTGGKVAPKRAPEESKPKEPVGTWFNSQTGQWEA